MLSVRDAFHCPPGPYFLSHSVGLAPRAASQLLDDGFLAPWRAGDSAVWDVWLATLDRFKTALARLLGGAAADFCPQTNVSSALTKALFAIPFEPQRPEIVLTREDFPTIGHVLSQAEKIGWRLKFLDGGPHLADPDVWRRAITPQTGLVHATHVFSNRGLRAPVAHIAAAACAAGARCIVDAAQSAGAVTLDVTQIGADIIVGTSVKYLCGGPGAAWMWVDPSVVGALEPIDVGWFSHRSPFTAPVDDFDYAPDASRFLGGTPSVAPFALAAAGIETLADIGAKAVEAHNQALMGQLLSALPANAVASHTTPGERGSSLLVRVADAPAAKAILADAGIACDIRWDALRLSVHLYNDETDIDQLAARMVPIIAG